MATALHTVTTPARASRPEPLSAEFITQFEQLERLRWDWERLWHANPDAEVFQHFAWIRAFWSAYGASSQLATIVVREGARVVGILALVVRDGTLQFLGTPESDYNDILCEAARAPEIIECGLREMLRLPVAWSRSRLENVNENSKLLRHWKGLAPDLRQRIRPVRGNLCPTILMGNVPPIKKSLRSHVLRQTRKLERRGALSFRHVENEPAARAHLRALFRQHRERLAMRAENSQFCQPRTRHFYRAMLQEPGLRPYLRFGLLQLDNACLGYHFGFAANGKYTWYKPTFNTGFWNYSPGEVLLNAVVNEAAAEGLREVDLTIGDETYKSRFSGAVRQNFRLACGRNTFHTQLQASALLTKNIAKQNTWLRDSGRDAKRRALQLADAMKLRLRRDGVSGCIARLANSAGAALFLKQELVLGRVVLEQAAVNDGFTVAAGTLGELAVGATRFRDLLGEAQLQALRVRSNASLLLIARHHGKLAGFALVTDITAEQPLREMQMPSSCTAPALIATSLWTAPDLDRRSGVIAALLAATGSMARERGLKALVLAPRSQVSGCDSVQPIARRRTISVLRRPVGEPRWTEL